MAEWYETVPKEYIGRCRALALELWPDAADVDLVFCMSAGDEGRVNVEDEELGQLMVEVPLVHLEAMLLAALGRPPEWVEQLAANWEKRGRSIRHEWLGAGFLTCAVELRDLAAGKLELHAGGIRVRKEGAGNG